MPPFRRVANAARNLLFVRFAHLAELNRLLTVRS